MRSVTCYWVAAFAIFAGCSSGGDETGKLDYHVLKDYGDAVGLVKEGNATLQLLLTDPQVAEQLLSADVERATGTLTVYYGTGEDEGVTWSDTLREPIEYSDVLYEMYRKMSGNPIADNRQYTRRDCKDSELDACINRDRNQGCTNDCTPIGYCNGVGGGNSACYTHDVCYIRNNCSQWSWLPWVGSYACDMCNADGVYDYNFLISGGYCKIGVPCVYALSGTCTGPDGTCVDADQTIDGQPVFHGPLSRGATVVGQSVPTSVGPGQLFLVSVTVRNDGNEAWTAGDQFKLGSQNPQDNTLWGFNRVNLAAYDTILPGQQKTFTFNATAPSTPGTYGFQWRMVQELITWFGGYSTNVNITVGSPPPTISYVSGTYGNNRIGQSGCSCATYNANWSIGPACNGRTSCSYRVDYTILGDCCPGYAKDFVTYYYCGSTLKGAWAPAEAGFGSLVNLSCP
jgi:hypothetical protein